MLWVLLIHEAAAKLTASIVHGHRVNHGIVLHLSEGSRCTRSELHCRVVVVRLEGERRVGHLEAAVRVLRAKHANTVIGKAIVVRISRIVRRRADLHRLLLAKRHLVSARLERI